MKQIGYAVLAAMALSAWESGAVELAEGVSVKGFGTLGLASSDAGEADFVASRYYQPNGAGRSRQTRYSVDSKAGGQIDWRVTPAIGLTAQVVAKQHEDASWAPRLEWAFAKGALSDTLSARVGRIRPAVYMLSDYLDVNYSNPWVRPPVEFYSSAPLTRMEGVDLLWTPRTGDINWLVQPYIGRSDLDMLNRIELAVRDIRGLNVSASKDNWSLRAGYLATNLTVASPLLDQAFGGLAALCANGNGDPAACSVATSLRADDSASTFASVGGSWDNGDYFASGEWGRRTSDSYVADATTWYLSAGARRGKWTPYLTYSRFRNDSPVSYSGSQHPVLAAKTNAIASALLVNNPMDQDTLTLGVRYDMARNVALKAQWDHVMTHCRDDRPGTCVGVFVDTTPGFGNEANRVNVVSVSVDVVF